MKKHFLLFDGHALIYRAYHALPDLTAPDGSLVNAVYGFTRILLTVLRDYEPEYVAVAFDHPTKTFRHQVYQDYKGHRPEMPDDLKPQTGWVKKVVQALNIPQFELAGFEADDLIGSLARQAENGSDPKNRPDVETLIITGDKDLIQLVDDQTHVFIPKRGKTTQDKEYDPELVQAEFGFRPQQIVDYKALMGDPSDNIPGVTGIGKKTALKLVQEFGSIEKLYQVIESDQAHPLLKGAILKKLESGHDQALMSRQLAQIDRQAPIKLDLPACRVTGYDKKQAVDVLTKFGFRSLIKLLPHDEFEVGIQDALF